MREFHVPGVGRIYGETITDALNKLPYIPLKRTLSNREKFMIEHEGYSLYVENNPSLFRKRDRFFHIIYKDTTNDR